ncbi:MAG: hypothetical protein U9Q04_10540 [Campylobacterota bacterium]|nr:hypothetical protein [Campylobacterota bacterium]
MKIKYSGPKPSINHHGVTFKDGKEDKYVYLMIALQILKAIDKDYEQNKEYNYDLSTKRLSDDEMFEIMKRYEHDLEDIANKEVAQYDQHLLEEINDIKENRTIKEVEKEIWVNNLNIMKEYRIQRAINKIYYMHAISYIVEVIKREHLKEINTPFFEKYWHVLQTIQGGFAHVKTPISTNLKILPNKDGALTAKLIIEGS